MVEDSVPRGHGFLSQWARAEARFPPFDPGQLRLAGHAPILPARPRSKLGVGLVSAPQPLQLRLPGLRVLSPAVIPYYEMGSLVLGTAAARQADRDSSSPVPCVVPVSWVVVCLFAPFALSNQFWDLGSTSKKEGHPLSPGRQGQGLRTQVDVLSPQR